MKIQQISIPKFIKNANLTNKINPSANSYNLDNLENNRSNSSFSYPIPFLGGFSLDLEATNTALKDNECPPDIKELVNKVLEDGNIDDNTLHDIHFEKYAGVLDCYTLDELKEKYPEFSNTISAYSVQRSVKGSVVDDFLQGTSEIFQSSEDLTLQLIKLYWGRGFSLSDLEKYTAQYTPNGKGVNLYYAMTKKLGIPLMSSHYASILKLSNKKYNTEFTTQMAIKRAEAKEAKEQLAEGEPVVIPKGHLSQAHKDHISQGLKEHFKNHPEKIYEMSERQKKFYAENPQEAGKLSVIGDYAWNKTQEGRSLKNGLMKFAKKQKAKIDVESLTDTDSIITKKNPVLIEFLNKNGWARDLLSTAMSKSWERYNSITTYFDGKSKKGVKMSFHSMDKISTQKILDWQEEQGIPPSLSPMNLCVISRANTNSGYSDHIKKHIADQKAIISLYDKNHDGEADFTASVRQIALIMLRNYLLDKSAKFSENPEDKSDFNYFVLYAFFVKLLDEIPIFEEKDGYSKSLIPNVTNVQLEQIMVDIMSAAFDLDCIDIGDKFNEMLDKAAVMVANNDRKGLEEVMK